MHVLDASRAVGVVGSLINEQQRESFADTVRADYDRVRQAHQDRGPKILRSLEEARKHRLSTDWTTVDIPTPSFTGVRTIDRLPLRELVPYIDWSPFFHTWELRGRYPGIFEDATVGPKAKELFEDAQALLEDIIRGELLTARGVYGFFPANSVGDDIELYRDQERRDVQARFHTLRQQMEKPADQYNLALADFIAPKESRRADYIGAFAVTAGIGVEALCAKYEKDHDDYNSIMTKALADRLAEAFAEWLHKQVRGEWGYGKTETLTLEDMIRERYRGIRPAPGYPACPDHTEKRTLFDLLGAEAASGVTLTESFAMLPAASVSGLYFAHPQAKYFAVGKINRDQVEEYATRKKLPVSEIERWLAPNLNYDT